MSPRVNFHVLPTKSTKNLKNFHVNYDLVKTRFGNCLIGVQDNKICHLSFQDQEILDLDPIKQDWPTAILSQDSTNMQNIASNIFDRNDTNFDVLIRGTDLQVKVWKALTDIEMGNTMSYEAMANYVGNPNAVRAVANAIAKNKIAYLIPCHRVIKKSGKINKYRWGTQRKQALLTFEANI